MWNRSSIIINSSDYRVCYILRLRYRTGSHNAVADETVITVTPNVDVTAGFTSLETEVGGTRDGQILWTLIDDLDNITYDWNAYVTFDHELTIIGS